MNLFKRIQFFDSTHINHWSFKFPELEYVGKIKIAGDRKHSNPFLQKIDVMFGIILCLIIFLEVYEVQKTIIT